jgi:CheY-like chemotaxis protein
MTDSERVFTILMTDDDAEDCLLVGEILARTPFKLRFLSLSSAEELLDYLLRESPAAPRPDLVLLDLNMPKKDGREALREIRSVERLRWLPIVVLTTSTAEEDVDSCYAAGANSFVTKPPSYRGWTELINNLLSYWFGVVRLPRAE